MIIWLVSGRSLLILNHTSLPDVIMVWNLHAYLHRSRFGILTTNYKFVDRSGASSFNSPRGRHSNILIADSITKCKIWTYVFLFQPCTILSNSWKTLRHLQARTREILRFKLFYFYFSVEVEEVKVVRCPLGWSLFGVPHIGLNHLREPSPISTNAA